MVAPRNQHDDEWTSARIAVIGAGSIGVAWSIVFAAAGLRVNLYDPSPSRLIVVGDEISASLRDLHGFGLISEAPEAVIERVTPAGELAAAVDGAVHVQECAPEVLDLKQRLFAELDLLTPADAVLASSSSFLPASRFASDLTGRQRVLVVHPGNPPTLLRIAELVPAPFTSAAVVERTDTLMRRCGLRPIRLGKEVDGFVFNRLQGAVLREAYCLVRDGVASPADIDLLMRDGLGLRWSLLGPFETVHLNTRGGIAAHAERMGPAYARMGRERGQDDAWTEDLVARVVADLAPRRPLENWAADVARRDRALMALLAARQSEAERLRRQADPPTPAKPQGT